MGMFDYVKVEAPCYKCGTMLNDFQTKDEDCMMELLELKTSDIYNFYTKCKNEECQAWNEYETVREIVGYKLKSETIRLED